METNINPDDSTMTNSGAPRSTNYTSMGGDYDRESWGHMMQRFYSDLNALFVREGELIRAEVSEKATQVKTGAASLVTAGVVLFVGLICVAATAIILINMVAPLWLSAVIVTVAFLVIGALMFAGAKKALEPEKLRPQKSIDAFEEVRISFKEKINEITKH